MSSEDKNPLPLAGRGRGGGRAEKSAPSITRTPTNWAPAFEQVRQKDLPRTAARSKRMRLAPTSSEARLWKLLKHVNREGANFRRQAAVDNYVYDFGDYSARMLIELDGSAHRLENAILLDAKKNAHAKEQGFRLLRVTNNDVWGRPNWVVDQVRACRAAPYPPPPPRKGEGES